MRTRNGGTCAAAKSARAFSSEVDTGSREENASKQNPCAPFQFHWNGKGSRVTPAVQLKCSVCSRVMLSSKLWNCAKICPNQDFTPLRTTIDMPVGGARTKRDKVKPGVSIACRRMGSSAAIL